MAGWAEIAGLAREGKEHIGSTVGAIYPDKAAMEIAAVGFAVGLSLALRLFTDQPAWAILLAALVMGVLGAVIAVLFQAMAVGIAGSLAGGYMAAWLLHFLGTSQSQWGWVIFIAGAITGAILAFCLFDFALVLLSALTGSSLIVQTTHLSPLATTLLFFVLVVISIVIQTATWGESGSRGG